MNGERPVTAASFPELLPADEVRPIHRLDADEIGDDPDRFYALAGDEPVLVRGVFADNHRLHRLDWEQVGAMFRGATLRAYVGGSVMGRQQPVDAEAYFASLASGEPSDKNVVDQPVHATPLGTWFERPAFLGDNWYRDNPFVEADPRWGGDGLLGVTLDQSLIATGRGNYTTLHADGSGMAGWMFLILGTKHWEALPPEAAAPLWRDAEKRFYDPRCDPPPPRLTVKYTGTMRAGDFMYFGPGWVHHVLTPEASLAVGGNMVNGYRLEGSVDDYLRDLDHGYVQIDLAGVLGTVPEERVPATQRGRVAGALAKIAA